MIRIIIADDHAIVRSGLKQILTTTDDIRVEAEASSGAQVMEVLRKSSFDLVLLDMTMPGFSGIDLIERIRTHDPKLPILVLSMSNDIQMVKRAIHAGATGYLTKDNEPEVLMSAVRKTATGRRFIDPQLAEKMVFELDGAANSSALEQLSNREFHILRLLACGRSVNDIANELAISNKTVSTHKSHLMRKMNFRSNAELVRFGMTHGLTD